MIGIRGQKSRQEAGDPGAWTMQERLDEIKGKLSLKIRNQEAYSEFSGQTIHENEQQIIKLRTELKGKQMAQQKYFRADEYVIWEGFKEDKESRLAMQRFSAEKAFLEKSEHLYEKIKRLNKARHEKNKKQQKVIELEKSLKCLRARSSGARIEARYSQRMRVLSTALEKMEMKCSSARFLHNTYKQIQFHLERDGLTLPRRLRELEKSLQRIKSEVNNELVQIQAEVKNACDQTKVEKEKLESKVLKGKRTRDATLAQTRKDLKKLNVETQDKDANLKKRKVVRIVEEMAEADRETKRIQSDKLWRSIGYFWPFKHAMDDLQRQVGVSEPEHIAECFVRQMQRFEELRGVVEGLEGRKRKMNNVAGNIREEMLKMEENVHIVLQDIEDHIQIVVASIGRTEEHIKYTLQEVFRIEEVILNVNTSIENLQNKVANYTLVEVKLNEWTRQVEIVTEKSRCSKICPPAVDPMQAVRSYEDQMMCIVDSLRRMGMREEDYPAVQETMQADPHQDMLIYVCSSATNNSRVAIDDDEEMLPAEDFLCNDDDTNEKYMSRDAIKLQMKMISESPTARKRRKKQNEK